MSNPITLNFGGPMLHVGLGHSRSFWVSMPKVSIDEDRDFLFRESKVRLPVVE